ncbi:MAG: BamA/TamA family outer membrane protein [Gemmatimonadaceae bacterium]
MRRVAMASVTCLLFPLALRAQQPAPAATGAWNDTSTMRLVDRAIARRSAQLADTGLTDYTAQAHGYLTFLAQVGEGFPDPPKVMKTDELAVEVYWRAPDQSKQRIVGRRDTLLLPTDISYHRDHLAIIQNNFPSIIRLGDGDEVRDVPHPLSPGGRLAYDFAIGDSLLMRTNDRSFEVIMVRVRPKDDRLPRAVGAVYIDRETATVVRMTFSFTRAALKDQYLEDVSVVLENGLVEGRYWLPRRQEIEIRRTGSWMDFPSRGIIRGRWEICCVRANAGLGADLFRGPEIVQAPPAELRAYPFTGAVLDQLPEDVKAATDDDVQAVQEAARELVRAGALARVRATNPSARSVSDIVRVNRVEGLAFGGGIRRTLGLGLSASLRARYGLSNRRGAGAASLTWERADGSSVVARALDDFAEAGDVPEVSGLRNSLAAQEFGADYTDPYRERVLALSGGHAYTSGLRWSLGVERRQERSLAVHATPSSGRYEPVLAAEALQAWRVGGEVRHSGQALARTSLSWRVAGFAERDRIDAGARLGDAGWLGRGVATLDLTRSMTAGTLVLRTLAGAVVGGFAPPAQRLVRLGGPVTAPGFDFHQFAGRTALSQRAEWQHGVPFVPLSLGRFGRVPSTLTLAPFVSAVWVDAQGAPGQGWHAAAGLGVLAFFDQLRIDVARGARDGRWTFSVDLSPGLWPIL